MKCKKCPALYVEGYEYPEEYCCLGFDETDYATDDGCTVNHNKIKRLVKDNEKAWIETLQTDWSDAE